MDKIIEENLQQLDELLRIAQDYILPPNYDNELSKLSDRSYRMEHSKRYPDCFLKLRLLSGMEFPYFSICNSNGISDAKIIEFSLKLAEESMNNTNEEDKKVDTEHLSQVIKKLQFLLRKYSKENIKPARMAALKGKATKLINDAIKYKKNVIEGK